MKYVKILWVHDYDEEPVEMLSEIGPDGYEVRKVHRFRDGYEWADENNETDRTGLGLVPIIPLEEIDAEPGLSSSEIDLAEFEWAWQRAREAL
jgi:hypothetical protein